MSPVARDVHHRLHYPIWYLPERRTGVVLTTRVSPHLRCIITTSASHWDNSHCWTAINIYNQFSNAMAGNWTQDKTPIVKKVALSFSWLQYDAPITTHHERVSSAFSFSLIGRRGKIWLLLLLLRWLRLSSDWHKSRSWKNFFYCVLAELQAAKQAIAFLSSAFAPLFLFFRIQKITEFL